MSAFYRFSLFALILAMLVIILGAYTRLKDAGLGCPDWPLCYGKIIVPKVTPEVAKIEPKKAWLEMIHRYFAGGLGLSIFILLIWAVARCQRYTMQPVIIPTLLSLMVVFQAALGMWTVTLSLLPWVVVAHLLGGVLIAGLLWALTLSGVESFRKIACKTSMGLKVAAIIGAVIIFFQIFLGGWVSANYAALICPDFPGCYGHWFPLLKLQEAFNFFPPIGVNYEGGVLGNEVRVTIQMIHRYGAFFVLLYIGALALYLIISRKTITRIGWSLLLLLGLQILLGVLNVWGRLPIPIALAHNFVAVLLFLGMVTLLCRIYFKSPVIIYS